MEPALTGVGAANWRLDGVRFESNTSGEGNIIELQDATAITMDRLLIIAGAAGQKRAIMGNGRQITLTRSHIANIWRSGQDSQAFCAWDGAGPYTLTDNYLEAASENVMFGGANSRAADRVPADILVEGNHFSKPLEWRGQGRAVKNLFELKSAKRVTVRRNLFERNWTDAQNGTAILFTVRNDEGGSPWSVVEDVLFEQNTIRETEGVFNILGYDGYQPSGRATRITIRDNLAIGTGTFLMAGGEVGTLTVDHNTVDQGGNFATLYNGDVWIAGASAPRPAQFAVETLTITNTLANHNEYGVFGDGAGIGTLALAGLTRTYQWTHNVLAGGTGQAYPGVTWRPTMAEHRAQFNPDYSLVAASWYRGAGNDRKALGVSVAGVLHAAGAGNECSDPALARRRRQIVRPLKDELVAAEPCASALHFRQREAPPAVEIEDLIGRRKLVRIAADPVENVVPSTHAAAAAVVGPGADVVAGSEPTRGAGQRSEFRWHRDGDCEWDARGTRQLVVGFLDPAPAPTPAAHVVIDGDHKSPSRLHRNGGVSKRLPHAARMVQDAPGVNDIERSERAHFVEVEHRAPFDGPRGVERIVPAPQLRRARNGLRIVVERVHGRAEPPGCEARQPTARPDVEKASPVEPRSLQCVLQASLGRNDPFFVEHRQEAGPVAPKVEALAARDFSRRASREFPSSVRSPTNGGSSLTP